MPKLLHRRFQKMNLTRYIENRFQELRYEESLNQEYSLTRSAHTIALQSVLQILRTILQWVYVPKVLVDFALVKAKLVKEPAPVLLNQMKESKIREDAIKNAVNVVNLKATEDVAKTK